MYVRACECVYAFGDIIYKCTIIILNNYQIKNYLFITAQLLS